jgi:RimJ/RimL family protein N-acetyltransferase
VSSVERVRTLNDDDADAAIAVVNAAAGWYADIVGDQVDGPEMTPDAFAEESSRMTWFGAFAGDDLIGVIGMEYVADVALLRHWYVDPARQRSGAGSALREHLEASVTGVDRIVAGTYEANFKARAALERAGYTLSQDCQAVLEAYYDIPADRRRTSVTYERRLEHHADA